MECAAQCGQVAAGNPQAHLCTFTRKNGAEECVTAVSAGPLPIAGGPGGALYCEVRLLRLRSRGPKKCPLVGVQLGPGSYGATRPPGHDPGSVGLALAGGLLFSESSRGAHYSAVEWKEGDVIGVWMAPARPAPAAATATAARPQPALQRLELAALPTTSPLGHVVGSMHWTDRHEHELEYRDEAGYSSSSYGCDVCCVWRSGPVYACRRPGCGRNGGWDCCLSCFAPDPAKVGPAELEAGSNPHGHQYGAEYPCEAHPAHALVFRHEIDDPRYPGGQFTCNHCRRDGSSAVHSVYQCALCTTDYHPRCVQVSGRPAPAEAKAAAPAKYELVFLHNGTPLGVAPCGGLGFDGESQLRLLVGLRSSLDALQINLSGPFEFGPPAAAAVADSGAAAGAMQPPPSATPVHTLDCLPKLPAPMAAELQGREAALAAALKDLSALCGLPVRFHWDPLAARRVLRGHLQARFGLIIAVYDLYLPALVDVLTRELADDDSASLLSRLWLTKTIRFSVVEPAFAPHPGQPVAVAWPRQTAKQGSAAAAAAAAAGPGPGPGPQPSSRDFALGVRFVRGEIELFVKPAQFGRHIDALRQLSLLDAVRSSFTSDTDAAQMRRLAARRSAARAARGQQRALLGTRHPPQPAPVAHLFSWRIPFRHIVFRAAMRLRQQQLSAEERHRRAAAHGGGGGGDSDSDGDAEEGEALVSEESLQLLSPPFELQGESWRMRLDGRTSNQTLHLERVSAVPPGRPGVEAKVSLAFELRHERASEGPRAHWSVASPHAFTPDKAAVALGSVHTHIQAAKAAQEKEAKARVAAGQPLSAAHGRGGGGGGGGAAGASDSDSDSHSSDLSTSDSDAECPSARSSGWRQQSLIYRPYLDEHGCLLLRLWLHVAGRPEPPRTLPPCSSRQLPLALRDELRALQPAIRSALAQLDDCFPQPQPQSEPQSESEQPQPQSQPQSQSESESALEQKRETYRRDLAERRKKILDAIAATSSSRKGAKLAARSALLVSPFHDEFVECGPVRWDPLSRSDNGFRTVEGPVGLTTLTIDRGETVYLMATEAVLTHGHWFFSVTLTSAPVWVGFGRNAPDGKPGWCVDVRRGMWVHNGREGTFPRVGSEAALDAKLRIHKGGAHSVVGVGLSIDSERGEASIRVWVDGKEWGVVFAGIPVADGFVPRLIFEAHQSDHTTQIRTSAAEIATTKCRLPDGFRPVAQYRMGVPAEKQPQIRFDWDVRALMRTLQQRSASPPGHSGRVERDRLWSSGAVAALPSLVAERYLPAVLSALRRELASPLTREVLLALWPARTLLFSLVAGDGPPAALPVAQALTLWRRANGLRLILPAAAGPGAAPVLSASGVPAPAGGALEILVSTAQLGELAADLSSFPLVDLLDQAPSRKYPLPLSTRIGLAQLAEQRDAVVAGLRRAVGIENIDWDWERDVAALAKQLQAHQLAQATAAAAAAATAAATASSSAVAAAAAAAPSSAAVDVRLLLEYGEFTRRAVAHGSSNALVRDALQQLLLRRGHLSVRISTRKLALLEGRRALSAGGHWALQFHKGELRVVCTPDGWGRDVSLIAHADIRALFDE